MWTGFSSILCLRREQQESRKRTAKQVCKGCSPRLPNAGKSLPHSAQPWGSCGSWEGFSTISSRQQRKQPLVTCWSLNQADALVCYPTRRETPLSRGAEPSDTHPGTGARAAKAICKHVEVFQVFWAAGSCRRRRHVPFFKIITSSLLESGAPGSQQHKLAFYLEAMR